jgi:hypothetical protein
MWSPEELSNLRFAMSDLPEPGGQRGDYEEKWSQWFLERSFFQRLHVPKSAWKEKGRGTGGCGRPLRRCWLARASEGPTRTA